MPAEGLPVLPCACANLRRAARAVTRLYGAMLRGTGLNVPQFTLLQVLQRQSALPMTQAALGEILALDSTTLTRTLAPLVERRWIRSRPGADRRAREWTITEAGQRAFARAQPRWVRVQDRLRTRLGDERWESLLAELTSVAAAVKRISAQPR